MNAFGRGTRLYAKFLFLWSSFRAIEIGVREFITLVLLVSEPAGDVTVRACRITN